MNDVKIDKEVLRKKYILIRNNVLNKKEKSIIICNKVIESIEYKNAKVIALYKSLPSEVDTEELINQAIKEGKIVCIPKVINDEMKFFRINSLKDKYVKSKFGVEEPIETETNYIDKENIDLVIVPGVCFDKEKNRIGFGKGYYDRFLKNTNLKTIAICFEEQIVKNMLIPTNENDVKMQIIITEKNLIK